MSSELLVAVSGKPVGQLYEESGKFIFNYLPTANEQDFVSLTMPVRKQSYVSQLLYLFFR